MVNIERRINTASKSIITINIGYVSEKLFHFFHKQKDSVSDFIDTIECFCSLHDYVREVEKSLIDETA
jgi:tRNA A37 threonylcarbamoyladenosine dehydratase